MILILMGVSGSGKSTIGHMLAEKLNWKFEDGDDFHPPSNKTKMSSGVPLNDTDRYQWLLNLHDIIQRWQKSMQHGIIVCSALKLKYRQVLISGHSAKYFDKNFIPSSGSKERCLQEIKTESPSELKGPSAEMEQSNIKKILDVSQHTPSSLSTTSVQNANAALPQQQEKHDRSATSYHHHYHAGDQYPQVLFIHLKGTMDLISSRLSQRKGHFFNPGLLKSQFDTLEELGADEDGIVVDISNTTDSLVSQIVAHVLPLVSEPI